MFEDFLNKILESNFRRIPARPHGDLTDGGRRRSDPRGYGGRGHGGGRNVISNNTGVADYLNKDDKNRSDNKSRTCYLCDKQGCSVQTCPENRGNYTVQDWHKYLKSKCKCTKCLQNYDPSHYCGGRSVCRYCKSNLHRLVCPCGQQSNGAGGGNTRYQQQQGNDRTMEQWKYPRSPAARD